MKNQSGSSYHVDTDADTDEDPTFRFSADPSLRIRIHNTANICKNVTSFENMLQLSETLSVEKLKPRESLPNANLQEYIDDFKQCTMVSHGILRTGLEQHETRTVDNPKHSVLWK